MICAVTTDKDDLAAQVRCLPLQRTTSDLKPVSATFDELGILSPMRWLFVVAVGVLALAACESGSESSLPEASSIISSISSVPQATTTTAFSPDPSLNLPTRTEPLELTVWLAREFDGLVGVPSGDFESHLDVLVSGTVTVWGGAIPEPRWVDDETVEYVAHTTGGTRVLRVATGGEVVTDVPFVEGSLPVAIDGAGNALFVSSAPGGGLAWRVVGADGVSSDLPYVIDVLAPHPESGFLVIADGVPAILDGGRLNPIVAPPADLVPDGAVPSAGAFARDGFVALAYGRTILVTQTIVGKPWVQLAAGDRAHVDYLGWDISGTALVFHDRGEARTDPRGGIWLCDLTTPDVCSRLWVDPKDRPVRESLTVLASKF